MNKPGGQYNNTKITAGNGDFRRRPKKHYVGPMKAMREAQRRRNRLARLPKKRRAN